MAAVRTQKFDPGMAVWHRKGLAPRREEGREHGWKRIRGPDAKFGVTGAKCDLRKEPLEGRGKRAEKREKREEKRETMVFCCFS